jgi:hypothetical protein
MTKLSTITLLAFVVSASALVSCKEMSEKANAANAQKPSKSDTSTVTAQPDGVPDKVLVYYFHSTRRCRTCLGIQAAIEKTVKERFATELASSALVFQDVNLDEPTNSHFAKDYNLSFSSMVVVAKKGQTTLKWENCDKVWEHAHNEPVLTEYAEKQIRSYVNMLKRT